MPSIPMNPQLEERFSYVTSALYLCNTALIELHILSKTRSREEVELVSGSPFDFYRVTLQYCFNSEYNKLLEERDKKHANSHFASVKILNEDIGKIGNDAAQEIQKTNIELIRKVDEHSFTKQTRLLRNKKFTHSDRHDINNPLSIKGLTESETDSASKLIEQLAEVVNNCYGLFDIHYELPSQHSDDQTNNFIRYHAVYKAFYYKHFLEAHAEGFGLDKK